MKKYLSLAIILLMLIPLVPIYHANAQQGVLVNKIIIQRIEEDATAVQSLENGNTQGRVFAINNPDTANQLRQEGFNVISAYSGLVDILVNPANNCSNGMFNIFANRKARFALEFLVPRDQIVANIYKGAAYPAVFSYIPWLPDYPFLAGTAVKWKSIVDIKGKEYGLKLLKQALEEEGAVLKNGKWYKDGKPVTVNFIIRVEDQRKDIGNMLADVLEHEANLTVNRLYKDFSAAYNIVYADDPGKCQWSLYTEGWGITGMTQYNYDDAVYFYSSIWGGMPGWGEPGYWNYANSTIDDIATKLDSGYYKDIQSFYKAINELLDLGFQESVRVWVAATSDQYIASPDLSGIVVSPVVYPWNTYTWLNLHYTGHIVKLSNRYVYKEGWVWNPVGGWADMYSRPVVDAISWAGITSRPTDGKTGWSPANTAVWKVERGNPVVQVPANALVYDHAQHKWVYAGDIGRSVAKVAVTINYPMLKKFKFHDGTTMSIADLLAPYYTIFEYAYDDSTGNVTDNRSEPVLQYLYSTLLNTFVAIQVVNDTAVRVYTNYTNVDDGRIAMAADPWTSYPLELYAAMDQLARTGYVYSIYSSGNPIHLLSPDQDKAMINDLEQHKTNPPDWVKQLIDLGILTQNDWKQRVDNLVNFYNKHHHLVIGNGAFMLDSYDAVNDVATLVRFADFPIPNDAVASELAPRHLELNAQAEDLAYNTQGTPIALINIKINGKPAQSSDVILHVLMINLNKYKTIFLKTEQLKPGIFKAELPSDMPEGQYQLVILAYPVGFSFPGTYQKIVTLQAPIQTTTTTTTTTTSTTTTTTTTTQPPSPSPTQTTTTTTAKGGTSATTIAAALIVVAIILVGAALLYSRK